MYIPRGGDAAIDQKRLGWWAVTLGVAVAIGAVAAAFVGTLVFGLFCYYATRPIHRRVADRLHGSGAAAGLTLLSVIVPLLVLVGYATTVAFDELVAVAGMDTANAVLSQFVGDAGSVSEFLQDPTSFVSQLDDIGRIQQGLEAVLASLGFVATGLLHLTLSLSLAFFLLRDGPRVHRWFLSDVTDEDSTAYAYVRGIDADLETVYFGNVLTILGVTVAAVVVYNGYNFVAPGPVGLPVPTLLALLTGLATFVPIVVGKLVYLPAAGYLFWQATEAQPGFVYPAAFLVVSFLLLDILPQTVLRPLISGRDLHTGLVLFAYVLGAAYFGWYGLFLGPLLVVVGVQLLKHVLPDLLGGDPFVPESDEGVRIGSDPLAEEGDRVDSAGSSGDAEGSPGDAAETGEE